jgi:hypothetical protein
MALRIPPSREDVQITLSVALSRLRETAPELPIAGIANAIFEAIRLRKLKVSGVPDEWRDNPGIDDWGTGAVFFGRPDASILSRKIIYPTVIYSEVLAIFEEPEPAAASGGKTCVEKKMNVAPGALVEFLKNTADGRLIERDLRLLAREHFKENHIPTIIWREALRQVPPNLKMLRGRRKPAG